LRALRSLRLRFLYRWQPPPHAGASA